MHKLGFFRTQMLYRRANAHVTMNPEFNTSQIFRFEQLTIDTVQKKLAGEEDSKCPRTEE